jgi:hypothetical protein
MSVLRSPNLRDGGEACVVHLYEVQPFARGGLALGSRKREVTLHLSTPEMKRLTAKWGRPYRNPKTRMDEYAFPKDGLKKFAVGGPVELAVGMAGPSQMQMSTPLTAPPPEPAPGRTRVANPVDDYYTYGMGPEKQFYTANAAPSAPAMVRLPTTPTGPGIQSVGGVGGAGGGGGGSGVNLGQVGGALSTAAGVANLLGYNNALTQGAATAGNLASGNYLGAAKSGLGLYKSLSGESPSTSSSASTGPSAASRALGGVGGALNIYGGLKQGDVGGYLQAGKGAAQLASAAGVGGSAVSSAVPILNLATGAYNTHKAIQAGKPKSAAVSGAMAGSAFGPVGMAIGAAVGAIFGSLNKDYKEEGVRDAYYGSLKKGLNLENSQQFIDPKTFYESVAGEFRGSRSKFPPRASGKYGQKDEDTFINDLKGRIDQARSSGVVGANDNAQSIMQKVVDPWFQQDFGGWKGDPKYPELIDNQKAMTVDLINRYISGSPVDWDVINQKAKGKAMGGLMTLAQGRHVRGPGTGRSDSIPAQLSDGEYVLTAEDVALLGDGSNEAGARRLDEFRAQLRKHKGGALSRGKISPNAKAPMQYLRGAR